MWRQEPFPSTFEAVYVQQCYLSYRNVQNHRGTCGSRKQYCSELNHVTTHSDRKWIYWLERGSLCSVCYHIVMLRDTRVGQSQANIILSVQRGAVRSRSQYFVTWLAPGVRLVSTCPNNKQSPGSTGAVVWSGKIWGGRCPEQTQQRCYPWLDTKNEWHKPGSHGLMSSWSVTRSITSDHFQFSKQTLLITGHDKSAEVNLKEDWSRGAGSPCHNICLGTVSGHSSGDQVWPGYNYGSASLLSLSTGSTINSHFSSVFSHKWHKQQWSQ